MGSGKPRQEPTLLFTLSAEAGQVSK